MQLKAKGLVSSIPAAIADQIWSASTEEKTLRIYRVIFLSLLISPIEVVMEIVYGESGGNCVGCP